MSTWKITYLLQIWLWLDRRVSSVPTQCKDFHFWEKQNKANPSIIALKTSKRVFQIRQTNLKNNKNPQVRLTARTSAPTSQVLLETLRKCFLFSISNKVVKAQSKVLSPCIHHTTLTDQKSTYPKHLEWPGRTRKKNP